MNGTSTINLHNIALAIDLINSLLDVEILHLNPSDFGIATKYSGQTREIRKALWKAGLQDVKTGTTSVGTTEFWQGKEGKIMIVDFVRASNDRGSVGFLAKKERLNVLLTRQEQYLYVIGDMTCCDSDFAYATTEDPEDEPSLPEEPTAESLTAAALLEL